MRRRGGGAPCWSRGTEPASDYLPAKVLAPRLASPQFQITGRRFSFLSTQNASSADGAAPHRVRVTGDAHSPLLPLQSNKSSVPLSQLGNFSSRQLILRQLDRPQIDSRRQILPRQLRVPARPMRLPDIE